MDNAAIIQKMNGSELGRLLGGADRLDLRLRCAAAAGAAMVSPSLPAFGAATACFYWLCSY
jgi:hypothetical protein